MATEQRSFNVGSIEAAADLSALQYRAVKMSSTGLTPCTVAGEKIAGVSQNKPITGQVVDLAVVGVTKFVAGAAVARGALVMTDTAGRVITSATAGSTIIGWALEAAGAAGDIITVLLNPAMGVV
jgi:hypothetical protein